MGKRRGKKTSNRARTHIFVSHCKPSFIVGAGRAFDLFGNMPIRCNRHSSSEDADHVAIYSDWVAVGNDLRQSMYAFEAEHSLNILKQLEEDANVERDATTVRG